MTLPYGAALAMARNANVPNQGQAHNIQDLAPVVVQNQPQPVVNVPNHPQPVVNVPNQLAVNVPNHPQPVVNVPNQLAVNVPNQLVVNVPNQPRIRPQNWTTREENLLLTAANHYQYIQSVQLRFETIKLDEQFSNTFTHRSWKALATKYSKLVKEGRVYVPQLDNAQQHNVGPHAQQNAGGSTC
ncbi:uncharacterized protein LOC123893951 [Trifolium pratense]|uniref:uncharacterized protein LOC123893951 n=1 Tax=Trifolium pratense TaxID=57577 RepID=UPI001E697D8C|nr:uncharacterized protein LOC123893951 [Trifolium pratense]